MTAPNDPSQPNPPHPEPGDRSVDAVLRAAATRQRRALVPAPDDTAAPLTLRHDGASASPPAAVTATPNRWRGALAAAALLALGGAGWWAFNPAPSSVPNVGPLAGPPTPDGPGPAKAPRGLDRLLAGAWPALDTALDLPGLPPLPRSSGAAGPLAALAADRVTRPLAVELDRMRSDVRRVLADLPRVSLRWDAPADDEPRTDRAAPGAAPSA